MTPAAIGIKPVTFLQARHAKTVGSTREPSTTCAGRRRRQQLSGVQNRTRGEVRRLQTIATTSDHPTRLQTIRPPGDDDIQPSATPELGADASGIAPGGRRRRAHPRRPHRCRSEPLPMPPTSPGRPPRTPGRPVASPLSRQIAGPRYGKAGPEGGVRGGDG